MTLAQNKSSKDGSYLKELNRIIFPNSAGVFVPLLRQTVRQAFFNFSLILFGGDVELAEGFTQENIDTIISYEDYPFSLLGLVGVRLVRAATRELAITLIAETFGLDPEGADVRAVIDALITAVTNFELSLFTQFTSQPFGPLSGSQVYFPLSDLSRRIYVQGVVNGTIIIDADRAAKIEGNLTYEQAVAKKIILAYIPSTWNVWHEYVQVGNYIYHIQEAFPVTTGLQIIDLSCPLNPVIVQGAQVSRQEKGIYSGFLFQGAHFLSAETQRPIVWFNGVTPINVNPAIVNQLPRNFQCEFAREGANNTLEPLEETPNVPEVASLNRITLHQHKRFVNLDVIHNSLVAQIDNKGFSVQRHPGDSKDASRQAPTDPRIVFGYDVSDPTDPALLATWYHAYVHDIQILKRGECYYAFMVAIFNEAIYVVDVTRPCNVNPLDYLAFFCFPPQQLIGWIDNSPDVSLTKTVPHSVYFSDCGNLAYIFGENTNIPIYTLDISDLTRMRIVDRFLLPRIGSLLHEARLEHCPDLGIARLWVSAYETGAVVLDLEHDWSEPELLAWNEAIVKTTPKGPIPVLCLGQAACGFWAHVPIVKNGISLAGSIGSRFSDEQQARGVGLSEDSAIVTFQLVKDNVCTTKKGKCKCKGSQCEIKLEPAVYADNEDWIKCILHQPKAYVTNPTVLSYISRRVVTCDK